MRIHTARADLYVPIHLERNRFDEAAMERVLRYIDGKSRSGGGADAEGG